jgi:flagellar motor switch protein FliM
MPLGATQRENLEGLFAGPQDLLASLPMLRTVLLKTASYWAEEMSKISATVPITALVGVESGPAEKMIAAMAGQGAACVLEAQEWNARLIACADHGFINSAIEMLLGGDGSEPQPAADRPITRVELKLIDVVFEQFASALEMAFGPVAPTPFVIGASGPQVSFEVLGRKTVPIIAARFSLSALGVGGDITLLLSQSVLSPMRNVLSRAAPEESIMPDPAWSQKIQSEVTRANVELVAVLDEQETSLAEVARFAVGHMLHLRATPDGLVSVECNGERLINCHIGKANGVYTLRVHDFVDQEQEFIEDILAS